MILAPIFGKILEGKKFNTAFEWCAGPAWIGLWLLETGICSELVTGDVNKKSVDMVKKTMVNHNYNVRAYTSDNLKHIPAYEKFDLVVSNPPNYCDIQQSHPLGFLRYDLRPSDINWNIHKNFYDNIRPHLYKDSVMYISEVAPYDKEVYLGNKDLYDLRSETPITDFTKMIEKNDLKITDTIPYIFDESLNTDFYILKIEPQ